MSSAVERLASELVKLSTEEWTKLAELRWAAEIAERLSEIQRDTPTTIAADEALTDDDSPKLIVRSRKQA